MSERSIYLRDQADKCRQHANIVCDARTREELRKLAAVYIALAEQIESKGRLEPPNACSWPKERLAHILRKNKVRPASVGGLFHSYQIVTTYSVSVCSFSLRTAAIAVCVFKTAPSPSVARKSFISLSSLPGSPLLSNILTFILSLRSPQRGGRAEAGGDCLMNVPNGRERHG